MWTLRQKLQNRNAIKIDFYFKDCVTLTKYNDCHSVEDSAHIGQNPHEESEFDWIHDVLNEEQASQFSDISVKVCNQHASNLLDFVFLQCQVKVQEFSKILK